MESQSKIKIVHFSDAHLDTFYTVGATADCGLQYCCRQDTETGKGSVKVGLWGSPPNDSNSCDIPLTTLRNAFQQIKDQGYDYLFWTGDSTAHDDASVNQ